MTVVSISTHSILIGILQSLNHVELSSDQLLVDYGSVATNGVLIDKAENQFSFNAFMMLLYFCVQLLANTMFR
jgi:hypothetical protein